MKLPMRILRQIGAVLLPALLCLMLAVPVAAAGAPFTDFAPDGWEWWCDGDRACVLLPVETHKGSQPRFMIVSRESRPDDWLIGWLAAGGDAVVFWDGHITANDAVWTARLANGNGYRAMVAYTEIWTVGAVSPQNAWQHDAAVFNATLKGRAE